MTTNNKREIEAETLTGAKVRFSIFDPKGTEPKLFIHGDFISGEWPLNKVGVMVYITENMAKMEFWPVVGGIYQSWYFQPWEFTALLKFFRSLGFPCPNPNPMRIDLKDEEDSHDEKPA